MNKNILFLTLLLAISSCNKDERYAGVIKGNKTDNTEDTTGEGDKTKTSVLSLETNISIPLADKENSGISGNAYFQEGEAIGIFACNGTIGIPYRGEQSYNNVQAILDKKKWKLNPDIELNRENAFLYAYYPYAQNVTDITNIPISVETQQDYLYGKNAEQQSGINVYNPFATINLKHAMSLLKFNIKKENYFLPGDFSAFRINGDLQKTADLDATDGLLKNPTKTDNIYYISKKSIVSVIPLDYDSKNQFSMIVFPMTVQSDNQVFLKATIDDREYSFALRKNTIFKAGYQYSFNLTIKAGILTANLVSISGWTQHKYDITIIG